MSIEGAPKTQENNLKEHLYSRGLSIPGSKGAMSERLTKSLSENLVAASTEKIVAISLIPKSRGITSNDRNIGARQVKASHVEAPHAPLELNEASTTVA